MPNFKLPKSQTIQFVSFEIGNYVIRICFVFRISCFEFAFLFNLCVLFAFAARPVEYPFHKSVIFSFTALFHGASLVEYRLDQDRVVRPKRYSTGRVIVYPIP